MKDTKEIAKSTRSHRKLHRIIGSLLVLFFFIIAITGLLLGWKKHSGGLILPETERGTSTDLTTWLSYDALHQKALVALTKNFPDQRSQRIDRIDARPDKGIVKFVFKDHYTEIQLDGATGKVLAVNQRTSDIIEQIHDGSILDFLFDTPDGQIKLVYTSMVGCGLALLSFTGFWLWYNPVRIRNKKKLNK
ncbi:PepSY-associated TM helix domain-containing protein [Oscillatoria amoena NRMC-F 0135]|nr:PepSY-associated TM helix domain-containing protein [Oscillatoria amoena NRMC-F 0135]